jgi:mycothiol synthase
MMPPSVEKAGAESFDRSYAGESDFWRIRDFLVKTYPITPLGFNWEVRRWDGVMFYGREPGIPSEIAGHIHLWQDSNDELIGVLHPERLGEIYLFVHPDHRQLEEKMLAWVETHLGEQEGDTHRQLVTFVYDYDSVRSCLLRERGYQATETLGVMRRLGLSEQGILGVSLPQGYQLSTTRQGDLSSAGRIADLLNDAFNRNTHIAEEHRTFSLQSPCYVGSLDLVAVDQEEQYVAYVGVAYDDVNRLGIFEPVCTHPEHRRKGLARALILEGLQRLVAMRASEAVVSTGAMEAANELYDSIGFQEKVTGRFWVKEIKD